ncbi:MAG TPA: hypothetical protein VGL65_11150 [Gemmatimonadales bacterium]
MTRLIRLAIAFAAGLLFAGCHSDSFAPADYGAVGPLHPGPEALIADTGSTPTWTDDGAGILYTTDGPPVDSSGCPTIKRPQPQAGGIAAVVMVPAVGGSAIWTHCESRAPMIFNPDSAEKFPAFAMASGGRLLYVEAIGSNPAAPPPCLCTPFPVGWHAELWVADSGGAASVPRRLLTLYHDHVGQSPFGPTDVDWLTDIHWIGASDYVALGQNLNPMGIFTNLGVVRGNTDGSGVQIVTGTTGAQHYSMAENNASIVFTVDSAIERVAAGGGTPTIVAHVAAIADISCKGEFCLVLGGGKFWGVDLGKGAVAALANDSHGFVSARLSPTSNSVVAAGSSGGIYLLTDLVH